MPTEHGVVEHISALRDIPSASLADLDSVYVEGYYAAGDGGGGHFFWKDNAAIGFTGTITSGSNLIQNATNVSQLRVGMEVNSLGVPDDTRIAAISGTTVTLTRPVTETATARPFAVTDNGITFRPDDASNSALAASRDRWVRIVDGSRNYDPRWFGAKGDAVTDDTGAIQDTIDAAMPAGVGVELSSGDYLVGPLYGNGRAWRDEPDPVKKVDGQQPSVLSFRGTGRAPFLCRLIAKPGAYAAGTDGQPGPAVLTFRNVVGVTISGFQIDANNAADVCGDFAWVGGTSATEIAAPSCHNEFTHLWGQSARRMGWNMDKAADCKVSAIHYRGGTASVGLSFRLGGGGIWADNVFLSMGKLLVTSQNCGLQNCGFFGGVEITGAALNNIHLDSCHLYPYTPKRSFATNLFNAFTTKNGTNVVTVNMAGHNLTTGDQVQITGAIGVGGVPASELNGPHLVTVPLGARDSFEFTVASNASPGGTGGGAATVFVLGPLATENGSSIVTVNMFDHGLKAGNKVQITGATGVGGILPEKLNKTHSVKAVLNPDQFEIDVITATASSKTSGGVKVATLVNPFTTTANSSDVTVSMPNHGLTTGNRVMFANAVAFTGGITAAQLNGSHAVTVVNSNPNQFKITVEGEPPWGQAAGGGTVTAVVYLEATGRGYTILSDPPMDSQVPPEPELSLGTQALTATTCWFNSMGVEGQHFFGGRWQQGARFAGCRFGWNAGATTSGTIYFDTANPDNKYSWIPASGYDLETGKATYPPLFHFDNCVFSAPRPETIEGKVLVGFNGYLNSGVVAVSVFEHPGELRLPRHPLAITYGGTGESTAYEAKDALTIKGANMAAAPTLNLATATGDYVEVTGTATITSFGTMPAGVRKTLRFQGTPTIAHGGSISVPGNQSITVSATNVVEVLSLGAGNWMVVGFSSAGFNASFLVAGTVSDDRLPSTMPDKTLTTALVTPKASTIVDLPAAAASNANQLRVVTNGAGGKRLVISSGTAWLYMDGLPV